MNEYTERLDKIEAALNRWLPPNLPKDIFPDVGENVTAENIRNLFEPIKDIFSRGGKRWRPLLMTLVCESLGGGDAAIPLSPLLEFPHNASLIHDDIEDGSDERRGKPTIHKIYGIDTAINSGAFFYFLALSCIENAAVSGEIKNKEQIYKFWGECLRTLHLGQSIDINWHRNISIIPSIDEYELMCRMKTGSLARLAVQLGASIAGASPQTIQQLGDAAEKMGIGFQILDDVKNLTTGVPGKKRGDDIVEGKKSLPILLYMSKYPEKEKKVFYYFHMANKYGIGTPSTEEFLDILASSSVFAEAEERGHLLINEAKKVFEPYTLLDGFFNLIS